MSKTDQLRVLREIKFEAQQALKQAKPAPAKHVDNDPPPMDNASPAMDNSATYKYRDKEKRRAYMRDQMRRKRAK